MQRLQRLSGNDALMLNMENPTTPMHTLKVAIIDSSRRGKAVTLDELIEVLPNYLGHFPRATQRVETASQTYSARPFWVYDENFNVADHLDERKAEEPGDRHALDAILTNLAVEQLDRSRPLWALTLVNGLADGQQAVVVRVHHAVADGLAALNTFMIATSEEGGTVAPCPIGELEPVEREELLTNAREESKRLIRDVPGATARFVKGIVTSRRFEDRHLVPQPMESARNSFSTPSGGERRCASADLALVRIQRVAVATETTVNGALHGVIAGAKRAEMIARSEDLRSPSVTVFGVAADLTSNRTAGNEISTALAYLRTDIDDPVDRLTATAQSCAAAVSKRRTVGFELTDQIAVYTGRTGPVFRKLAAPVVPRVVNNITTANLPGPRQTRWAGQIEVVDWISFALAIAPADVNLTAYSYAGRISMGLITTPESMPDPERFLGRVAESLDTVEAALVERGMLDLSAETAGKPDEKAK